MMSLFGPEGFVEGKEADQILTSKTKPLSEITYKMAREIRIPIEAGQVSWMG